ncbi:MAG: hypothetical protein NTV34_14240, partial [Proteobacteria bacterium]|nr:hypothetical protein [Pseudomonadota bacterium]
EGFFLTIVSTVAGIFCGVVAMLLLNNLGIKFTPPGVEGGIFLLIVPNFQVGILATLCVSSLGIIATWLAIAGISQKNIAELIAGAHR